MARAGRKVRGTGASTRKPAKPGPERKDRGEAHMAEAIALSLRGMRSGQGGPFGAVVAKGGVIVGRGNNRVLASHDPTAHAEVLALRDAGKRLGTFDLSGCELYTSCEPCPMCLAAAYWARIDRIYFGNTRRHAAAIGFADAFLYRELRKAPKRRRMPSAQMMTEPAREAFREWAADPRKRHYGPSAK